MHTDLIIKAKSGDEMALKELYDKYYLVALSVRRRFYIRDFDYDDWYQEGFIIFYKCVMVFDLDKKLSIGTLFKRSFVNHIISILRRNDARKRKINNISESLDKQSEKDFKVFDHYNSIDALDAVIAIETLDIALETLTPNEKSAVYSKEQLNLAMVNSYNRGRRKIIKRFEEEARV